MKDLLTLFLSLLTISQVQSQSSYLDYQLRLEPVWSRVADALGEPGSVESVEFSPDGKYIVSGTKYDNSVIMWRTSDGAELWRQYTAQEVERVGWSADGQFVAAASEDYKVTVYQAETGEVANILEHTQGIDGLTWSHQGKLLVTGEEMIELEDGSTTGWIRVYDMENNAKEIQKMNFGRTVNELFFSADDQYLLAVGHGSIKVYETENWEMLQELTPGFYVTFTSGVFSPDAKYVIAVGQSSQVRGTAYLWEWKTGKLLKSFNHTGRKIESIAWHPSGDYIAHAGHDPFIYLYRFADIMNYSNDDIPMAAQIWASDHAEFIDFNADGSFLVSAHQNGLIKLWVWMGEQSNLNSQRHQYIIKEQETQGNKE